MSKEIKQELKNISPQLSMVKDFKEFQEATPEGYFVHLSDRILHQIYENSALQKRGVPEVSLLEKIKKWSSRIWVPKYSMALSICFISIGIYFVSINRVVDEQELLKAINKSEGLEYLFNHSEELDESMLSHLIEMPNNLALKDEHEQITNYLEENINTDDIEEI